MDTASRMRAQDIIIYNRGTEIMAVPTPEKAAGEAIKASREAVAFFQEFDKRNVYLAAAQRDTGWLLGERALECETAPCRYVPISAFESANEGAGLATYTVLVPTKNGTQSKPLRLEELNRIVYELVVGVYVFNQVPAISLQPNHDGSSSCNLPAAYHDTLVGSVLLEVDYFVKSLLHGTIIPQSIKRERVNDVWRTKTSEGLRETLKNMGLVFLIDDPELGPELYEPRKDVFVRLPAKCVDQELAESELILRLTTGQEFEQQEAHLSHDMFLRYLDQVGIDLVFRPNSIQQVGSLFVMDTSFEITTRVCLTKTEEDPELYRHLQTYLQNQRCFLAENLYKKKEISHNLDLLHFISFMTQLLVTLKLHNKVVSVDALHGAKSGDVIRTNRELPPTLPSENSRWSPFKDQDSVARLRGGVLFHLLHREVTTPNSDFLTAYESLKANGSLMDTKKLATCKVRDEEFLVFSFAVEDFYTKSPKVPRWVHAMITELQTQCASLPSLSSRVNELLKKPFHPKQVFRMKTVLAQLQASVEKGILPLVALLLKRCTKTRLVKPDEQGKALVHYAAMNCQTDVLSALLYAGSIVDQTCMTPGPDGKPTKTQSIHLAARSGGLDTVMCLIHFGADVLVEDEDGWTAVHHAAFHNYQSVVLHICTIEKKCTELKTNDQSSATPLLLAAKNGGYDVIRCLVKLRADVTAKNRVGQGLVQLVALRYHISILKYLVELNHPELSVWADLSAMLSADLGSGYPKAAARCLDALSQWNSDVSTHLLEFNAIPSLVQMMMVKDIRVQHLAVQVLANMSCIDDIKEALNLSDAISPLVELLTSASERVQGCACTVICDLATSPKMQADIAEAGAIPQLVKLLASDADNVQLTSCAALGILADSSSANQDAITAAAVLPALKTLLTSDLACIQACATSTLQMVTESNRSSQLSVLSLDILPHLIRLLRSKEILVHTNAALAIEAMAENCEEAQQEILAHPVCISLLQRLLKMQDQRVKVASTCALWSIAGSLINNRRLVAEHMGLPLLINMLTLHNEKLDYISSEALGSLATELGDNQRKIMEVGGVKPLVEILTIATSQRVYLSTINTISKLLLKRGLAPNKFLQKAVVESRGIPALASIACSQKVTDVVRISAACALAHMSLGNPAYLKMIQSGTGFSCGLVFRFLDSNDPKVRVQAGQCLAVLAFNNPAMVQYMRENHNLDMSVYVPFLESNDEHLQCFAGLQLVVLSQILKGVKEVDAVIKGIQLLVQLLSSTVESTQVQSAEFLAYLSHFSTGIPEAIVMAGALDHLINYLTNGSTPVIENCCVALGYLSFHVTPARMMIGIFREQPEKFEVFREYSGKVVHSRQFRQRWEEEERVGLPVLRLVLQMCMWYNCYITISCTIICCVY